MAGEMETKVRLIVDDSDSTKKIDKYNRQMKGLGETLDEAAKKAARGNSLQKQAIDMTQRAAAAYQTQLDKLETKSATFGLKGVERLKAQRAEFLSLGRNVGVATDQIERATTAYDRMIARAEKAATRSNVGLSQRANGLAANARNIAAAAGVTLGLNTVFNIGEESVKEAARVEQLGIALGELEQRLGKARGSLSGAAREVAELGFTSRQSRELVLALSTAGVSLNTSIQLASGALDAASRTGQTLDYTIDRIARGVPRLSGEITEELGVVVRLNDATKAYASTLGLANDQHLTAEQRVQAYAEALAGKLNGAAGTYSATMGTLARQLQDINQQQVGTREALGKLIAPQVLATAQTYGNVLEGIKSTLEFLQASGGLQTVMRTVFPFARLFTPTPAKPSVTLRIPADQPDVPAPPTVPGLPKDAAKIPRFNEALLDPYLYARTRAEQQLRQARALFALPNPALSLFGGAPQGISGAVDQYGLPVGPARAPGDAPDPSRSLEAYKQLVDDRERYFRDESQRTFELIKSQSGDLFDAMIAGGDRFWDFFRNAGLTVVKDIFSGLTATTLTGAFGGRSPAQALGLAGLLGPGGTSGFTGSVGSVAGRTGGTAALGGATALGAALSSGLYGFGGGFLGSQVPGGRAVKAGAAGGLTLAGGIFGSGLAAGAGFGGSLGLLGVALSNPIGAIAVGAAVGVPALIASFTSSAKDKAKEKIKSIYGVTINDKNVLDQIVGIGKSYAGGNLDVAVHMPIVQELVYAYSMATGNDGNTSLIGNNFPRGVSIVQRSGRAMIEPQYINGSAFAYASKFQPAPVSVNRDVAIITLDKETTTNLIETGSTRAIVNNPRLVQQSNQRGLQHSSGRRESFAIQAEPYAVTG